MIKYLNILHLSNITNIGGNYMNMYGLRLIQNIGIGILLELGYVIPEDEKDILVVPKARIAEIKISDKISINILEINIVGLECEIRNITIRYNIAISGVQCIEVLVEIKSDVNYCFTKSDSRIKEDFKLSRDIDNTYLRKIEAWANNLLCEHYEATGHRSGENNKDTL